jgi:hypothetical protein
LEVRLVMKDRSATDVSLYSDRREIGGQVLISADVQPGGGAAAVDKAMDEEILRNSGLPDDYYTTFGPRIAGLTNDDITQVVREVVRPAQQAVLVVGDRAKVEAGIRDLGLGSIRYLDGDGRPKP